MSTRNVIKKLPLKKRMLVARRLENRDRDPRRRRWPFPNTSEFGRRGEWVDAQGRQYRLAIFKDSSEWTPGLPIAWLSNTQRDALLEQKKKKKKGDVVLWVKLKKNTDAAGWFDLRRQGLETLVELRPGADGIPPLSIRVHAGDRRLPLGRTGMIRVSLF